MAKLYIYMQKSLKASSPNLLYLINNFCFLRKWITGIPLVKENTAMDFIFWPINLTD